MLIPIAGRRTTPELIEELDREAEGCALSAIIVGFDTTTAFVFAGDGNRLRTLNTLYRRRGLPVGIVGLRRVGTGLIYVYHPFREFTNRRGASEYLARFEDVVRAIYRGQLHPLLRCPENN